MKKAISLTLALILVLGLAACSSATSGVPQEQYDALKDDYDALKAEYDALKAQIDGDSVPNGGNDATENNPSGSKDDDKPSGKFDEDTVISQLEVQELSYSSDFWHYAFLVIKNNSEYDISINVNVNFYNSDGNLVGAKNTSEEAFEHGQSILLYFMPDEEYASMEYEFDVEEEKWYDCVLSDLTYEATPAQDKVILSVTNNGDEAAEFVQANVLFFNGDKLVGFSNNYITDDDSEIKPGKTINKEMDCYEDFDSYQVYFSGRR